MRLKIGPYNYTVKDVDCVSKSEPFCGLILYAEQEIRLDSDLMPERRVETLLHEAIHGIDEYMSTDLSEAQVKSLGIGITMLLRDNPELVELVADLSESEAV